MGSETMNKPDYCPFCGHPSTDIARDHDSHADFFYVTCDRCEAAGPTDYDREKAVERWNHRAQEADYDC